MFDLIERAEHYPAFLPWCAAATILERDDAIVAARIAVAWHGVNFEIVTRNPKKRPEWLLGADGAGARSAASTATGGSARSRRRRARSNSRCAANSTTPSCAASPARYSNA